MLEVRHPRFHWQDTPLNWIPDDPHTTKVIDVLHLLLPAGERWMARVMNQAVPLIEDAALRADVDGFLRQEAWHGRSHAQVVEHWKELGVDATPYTRQIDWLFEQLLADKPFGKRVPARLRKRWIAWRVAMIAAIEHYTAVLAEFALDPAFLANTNADPMMRELILWHAAEEAEHGHVAFESSIALGVGGVARRLLFALITAAIWYEWIRGVRFLARVDPDRNVRASWKEFFRAARQGRLPTLRSALRWSISYYKPLYHPRKQFTTARAIEVLAHLPAVRAARQPSG